MVTRSGVFVWVVVGRSKGKRKTQTNLARKERARREEESHNL